MRQQAENKIVVALEGKKCTLVLDSGAEINCIDLKFLNQRLRCRYDRLQPSDPLRFNTADGSRMTVVGKVNLNVMIDGLRFPAEFFVMRHLFDNCLLGCKFMQENTVIIDFRRKLAIFDGAVSAKLLPKTRIMYSRPLDKA